MEMEQVHPTKIETNRNQGTTRLAEHSLFVVESLQGFDALESEWNLLFDESGLSVFQSFDWLRTWWKYFGEGSSCAHLYIVVIKDGRGLVAIAPFFVQSSPRWGALALRKLCFIGHKDSDYLDVLMAKGYESELTELLAAHLADFSTEFDLLLLQEIPERSPTSKILYDALSRRQFSGRLYINEYCPRTQLLGSWEATVRSFSSTHRRHINQRRRQLRENFAAEFELTSEQKDVSQCMTDFVHLHQGGWNKRGFKGVFSDQRMVPFHQEVAQRCFNRGWLFLAFLRLDGKRIATLYGFRFRDELEYYLGGVDQDSTAMAYSPGSVLHSFAIEAAIKEGKNTYDFMRGRERYKYTFGAVDCANWTILMFPSGSRRLKFRFWLDQIATKIGTRLEQERYLMNQLLTTNGFKPTLVVSHFWRRLRRNITDAIKRG